MGKKDKHDDDDEDQSLFRQALGMVTDYVFSMIIPVGILLYAAPHKSTEFIADSVKSKVSAISEIGLEDVTFAATSTYEKALPMLQSEVEFIQSLYHTVPTYFESVSKFLTLVPWEYMAGASAVLLVALLFFPWHVITKRVSNTIWRTVGLFVGLMPLDDGLDVLSDKETGNYQIVIVFAAILATIVVNFLAFWLVRIILRFVGSVIAGWSKSLFFATVGRPLRKSKVIEKPDPVLEANSKKVK